MKKTIIWLIVIAIIAAVAVYLYVFKFGAKHSDPLNSSDIIHIDAKELYNAFNTGEDSANAKYLGKTIMVHGTIATLEFNKNRYTISFENGDEMGTVICEMDTTQNETVKKLGSGNVVKVAGFCNGINLDVYLDRCKLAE